MMAYSFTPSQESLPSLLWRRRAEGWMRILELTREVELDVLKVLLCHAQHIAGVGEEDITAFYVLGHILILTLLEVFKFGCIITLYPASLVEMDGLPAALGIVLVLKAVLDDLKLQLTDGTDDTAVVELVDEHLCYALVHQLLDTFLELLRLHGVVILDILEQLRREGGKSAEVELLTFGQRVTNLEDAVVGQSYDVSRPRLVHGALTLSHELGRRGEAHGLVETYVVIRLVAKELTGTYLAEGDARTVVRVDVCRDLEDEPRELRLIGLHDALFSLRWLRVGSNLNEAVEELLYTEVVEGRTEEYGCNLCFAVVLDIERWVHAVDEFEVIAQMLGEVFTDVLLEIRRLYVDLYFLRLTLLVGCEEVEVVLKDVVHALELHALSDRPGERPYVDMQLLLQFVEQVERVTAFAVHLVDEDDDGCVAHAADLHELTRLRLHTFG